MDDIILGAIYGMVYMQLFCLGFFGCLGCVQPKIALRVIVCKTCCPHLCIMKVGFLTCVIF